MRICVSRQTPRTPSSPSMATVARSDMRPAQTRLLLIVSTSMTIQLPAPSAGAEPVPLPGPPPYVPGAPDAEPGSFDYPYNVIAVGPPAATDSRGVRIGSNVDP